MISIEQKFNSFKEFYPFYVSQHQNSICRLLHFIGTICVIFLLLASFVSFKNLFLIPIFGYGFAWIGHYIFERNKPATLKNPFYSLMGDFYMFWNIITNKEKIFDE